MTSTNSQALQGWFHAAWMLKMAHLTHRWLRQMCGLDHALQAIWRCRSRGPAFRRLRTLSGCHVPGTGRS